MFHIVFKALFTEFCNCACEKKIVMLIRIWHTCVASLHKKTVLSLETSSEINFEFIKFVKKGKCLPLTKTLMSKAGFPAAFLKKNLGENQENYLQKTREKNRKI